MSTNDLHGHSCDVVPFVRAAVCPLRNQPQFPGLSTHIITYYTMGTPLIKEMALALWCFVSSLVEKAQDNRDGFDGSSCEGVR